jgi:hypothetical protein
VDRTEAWLRARQSADQAASLRERGEEYAAHTAEISSRAWLRKFAALNEQMPDGIANADDAPLAQP